MHSHAGLAGYRLIKPSADARALPHHTAASRAARMHHTRRKSYFKRSAHGHSPKTTRPAASRRRAPRHSPTPPHPHPRPAYGRVTSADHQRSSLSMSSTTEPR